MREGNVEFGFFFLREREKFNAYRHAFLTSASIFLYRSSILVISLNIQCDMNFEVPPFLHQTLVRVRLAQIHFVMCVVICFVFESCDVL